MKKKTAYRINLEKKLISNRFGCGTEADQCENY